ncbi:MAG TPA: transcription antitermination factor NusB [Bryobacteraceae bacterium]|nr:transcription antitermination factor NusB [Bryobacteraceae bacterium]
MNRNVSPAREAAFRILERVEDGAYASDLLRRETLSERDAALAESIVMGTLRYQSQLDFLIEHFSGRRTGLDREVRIALRMGIFQLRYLDRIPAHAAVVESVEMVKRARKRSAAGLVNAVLRKVNRDAVAWPSRAVRWSIPEWMLARWDAQFGEETAEKIAGAALAEPQVYINAETGRQQDIGAQSIVPLLEIEPGMSVLDLCAAPGNKTAQAIAAGGRVIAGDRYLSRLGEVPGEAMRVALDASRPLPFRANFDRILIDAPCSGTGTLARNPEIKWRLKPQDLLGFQQKQKQILAGGLAHLKPGGTLVYSTCSLEREENEDVIRGHDARICMRIPGVDPGDGFFAAVLSKPAVIR